MLSSVPRNVEDETQFSGCHREKGIQIVGVEKRESEKTNIKRKWGNTWPKERNFRALEQALNSLYGLELEPTCRHSSVSRVSCSSKRLNAMMSRH